MPAVRLTDRAARDIDDIDRYSAKQWGRRVANRYLQDIGAALDRIAEKPDLIAPRPESHLRLGFYRVRNHVLVCDSIDDDVYVLTVSHTSMDLPARLVALEQQLALEAQILHSSILASRSRRT